MAKHSLDEFKTYLQTRKDLTDAIKNLSDEAITNSVCTTKHWKPLVDVWFSFYAWAKNGEVPTFDGVSSNKLKLIIQNLEKRAKKKGWEWSEETAVSSFKHFLLYASKDDWLMNNLLLANLNLKFDTIITNGKGTTKQVKGQQPTSVKSAYETFSKLNNDVG